MVSWDHTCSMFPCEADTGAEMAHTYLYDDQGEYPLSYTMGFRAPAEGEGMAKPFLQQQKERAAKLAKEKEEKEAREAQLHEPIAMPAASPAETRQKGRQVRTRCTEDGRLVQPSSRTSQRHRKNLNGASDHEGSGGRHREQMQVSNAEEDGGSRAGSGRHGSNAGGSE